MSQASLCSLRAGALKLVKGNREILHGRTDDGVMVCGYIPGQGGGAFLLNAAQIGRTEQYLEELIAMLRSTFSKTEQKQKILFKIIGPQKIREKIRGLLECPDFILAAEEDAERFEVFFSPDSGQVRLTDTGAAA